MRRLASFILAIIFLGSNLGLAMGTHYCGGFVMEEAILLGHDDLSCGMMPESENHQTEHQHKQQLNSIPCCANEFQSLQIEDDFQLSVVKVWVEQVALPVPLYSVSTTAAAPAKNLIVEVYPPPLRTEDITILTRVFRI